MKIKQTKKRGLIFHLVIWSIILCGFIVNDVLDHPEDAQAGYADFIQNK